MHTEASSRARKIPTPFRRWIGYLISYGIGAACLFWVFHDVRPSELIRSVTKINWGWVPVAAALDLLVYVCAAWEWQFLLRPIGSLRFRQTLQAVFAGRFANDVLPVHAGYILRIYLVAKWTGKSATEVIPSLLIERLLDGFWLAICIGVIILIFPLPGEWARAGEILGSLILLGITVVTWVICRKSARTHLRARGRWSRNRVIARIASFIERLAEGVRDIGRSKLVPVALALSAVRLLLQALAFLSLLWAYAFDFPLRVKLAICFITYIGISIPSTPAGVGVFQIVCAFGLRFFGVPKPMASAFALLAYVVLTAPLAIAGLVAVGQSGLTFGEMRRAIDQKKAHHVQ